jgi:hypothetical protein
MLPVYGYQKVPGYRGGAEGQSMTDAAQETTKKKRKPGIPTGNAGEYFVMGELLRRGYDAQLADRNTKGYDLLVGRSTDPALRKVQVKTVRAAPWYVKIDNFTGALAQQVTVYVLIGPETASRPIRNFIAKNERLASELHRPKGWKDHAFMSIKAVAEYENHWDDILG